MYTAIRRPVLATAHAGALSFACILLLGCATAPTAPPASAALPQGQQVWRGTAALASVTAMSEDLAACLDGSGAARVMAQGPAGGAVTLSVDRTGPRLRAALATDDTLSCEYTGEADASAFALTSSRCSGAPLTLRCGQTPQGLDRTLALNPLGSTVNATTVSGRLAGTVTRIYRVEGGGELILGYALAAPAL